ncbi:MAG: DUF962 domain-containing protein, partial [Lysobacteraceae bacterium]
MSTAQRPIDAWFAHYAGDHQNTTNQRIHVIAVPLILWSVIGLLWCVPVPGTLFRQGLWAAAAMFLAWLFYYRASRAIGFGMLAIFVAMAWLTRWLHDSQGTPSASLNRPGVPWLSCSQRVRQAIATKIA